MFRMKLMGARVIPVESGLKTLKDALNEAMRDWMGSVEHTHYIIGTVAGPHPFPMIVRDFQSVIGIEIDAAVPGKVRPVARCDRGVRRRRIERGGDVLSVCRRYAGEAIWRGGGRKGHRAGAACGDRCRMGRRGCCTGRCRMCCRMPTGRRRMCISVSAGLDYPGVGPEHAYWKDTARVTYASISDGRRWRRFRCVAAGGDNSGAGIGTCGGYALQLAGNVEGPDIGDQSFGAGTRIAWKSPRLLEQQKK